MLGLAQTTCKFNNTCLYLELECTTSIRTVFKAVMLHLKKYLLSSELAFLCVKQHHLPHTTHQVDKNLGSVMNPCNSDFTEKTDDTLYRDEFAFLGFSMKSLWKSLQYYNFP